MKRGLTALITFVAITTARAADIATTLHFTPDLKQEGNPLVFLLGMELIPFLATNIIVVLLFSVIPLIIYWRCPGKTLDEKMSSAWDYASVSLYNRKMEKSEFLKTFILGCPLPKDWIQAIRCMGITLSWTIIFVSWIAVLSWWATRAWSWDIYKKIWNALFIGNIPLHIILITLSVYIITTALYFRAEHKIANQNFEPIVPTPAESGSAQSTQAHV